MLTDGSTFLSMNYSSLHVFLLEHFIYAFCTFSQARNPGLGILRHASDTGADSPVGAFHVSVLRGTDGRHGGPVRPDGHADPLPDPAHPRTG